MEALLQRGVQVRCLVRPTSHLKWLKGLPVEIIYGDCQEKDSLGPGVKDVDLVFHLAGVTRAIAAKTYFEVNALGTENLIQACLEHNTRLQKFIYLSSLAAAGPGRNGEKKKESDPCEPVSPYGRSKRRGEELALSQAHELPLLILRPAAVYGPRDKAFLGSFSVSRQKDQALYLRRRSTPQPVLGPGSGRRAPLGGLDPHPEWGNIFSVGWARLPDGGN